MLFASSKDALRRALVGIAAEIQGTDFSEVAHESGMSTSFTTPLLDGAKLLTSLFIDYSSRQGLPWGLIPPDITLIRLLVVPPSRPYTF